jgi:inhibitor of cysteine peptidase
MKKFSLTIGALLATLCVVTLAAAATVVRMPDNGKQIQVKAGAVIELALKEQAGTGYIWEFQNLDPRHFKVLRTRANSLAEPHRVGGPLLRVWQIKALAPGVTRLSLDYLRPWEGRAKAVKHFEIRVHIQ